MDKQLRTLRLKALQDDKDPNILWRYIRALERTCGADDSPRKLFAVLNDGTLEGDSIFGAHSEAFLPYTEGECQYSLLDKWTDQCWNGDDMSEYFDEIVQFWVVDELARDFCDQVREGGIGDSYCYAANTARKAHCVENAIKIVRWKSECDCAGCQ